jgi:hypothetical protein
MGNILSRRTITVGGLLSLRGQVRDGLRLEAFVAP